MGILRSAVIALALLFAGCGEDELLVDDAPFDPEALASPREARDLDPDPSVVRVRLRAEPALHLIDGVEAPGYAYDGLLPGPTIRGRIGDTLFVEFENALDAPTTIHWHGMSVPYAMDGVTWQTDPVVAGEHFVYTFQLKAAGTFWYHPHFDSAGQVDRGLYGALVVEDPTEPDLEELVLVFDRWGEVLESQGSRVHGALPASPGVQVLHDDGAASSVGAWTVNGRVRPKLVRPAGSALRVRLLNASSDEYLELGWPSIRHIASDQGLLSALAEPERLLLGPGDRAEVEWLLGTEDFHVVAHPYSKNGGAALGEPSVLFDVATSGDAVPPPGANWPFSGLAQAADPGASDIVYVFTGDPITGDWRINGELFPDVTIQSLALGSTAVIEVRNASATEHPFHLHGHAFEVLTAGGVAPSSRTIEDTVNVRIGESVRVGLVADNPGDWMAHCHILSHADAGMMTVLRVEAP